MLLVVAELDRAMRMGLSSQKIGCKLPDGNEKERRIVREVLEQIGLLHRIGFSPPPSRLGDKEYDESVRHWRYATGTRVDEEPGDVLESYEGRISDGLMESMQIGLTEALLNSLHHAYRGPREDGCRPFAERRWWMFTHHRDGLLSVLVCDLGIGIPRSLPLKWGKDVLKRLSAIFTGSPPEVAAVKMALVLGKSSTDEEHRGRGLPQVWNATQASSAGGVGIMSGKAYVGFDSESGETFETQFRGDMHGTLITWTVPTEARDEAK